MAESMASMAEKALRIKPGGDSGVDHHTYGTVESANADGSYQIRIDGAATATRCASACAAASGDRVLVLVKSDGKCAAVGRVGGLRSVEVASMVPSSKTSSCTVSVAALPSSLIRYVVVYWRCTYTGALGEAKVPLASGGGAKKFCMHSMTDGNGGSQCIWCWEEAYVSLGDAVLTITRGAARRAALSSSGASVNDSPGTQFSIEEVAFCA